MSVGEAVRFTSEHRVYLLDGAVDMASRYARGGRLSLGPASTGALAFAAGPLATLPSAIVVDVGLADGRWSVIEANAAWAAGM